MTRIWAKSSHMQFNEKCPLDNLFLVALFFSSKPPAGITPNMHRIKTPPYQEKMTFKYENQFF